MPLDADARNRHRRTARIDGGTVDGGGFPKSHRTRVRLNALLVRHMDAGRDAAAR
jgi:hypothetical protein